MTSPTWFAIRGEEYMYDQGKWWRRLKVGDWCSGAFQYRFIDRDMGDEWDDRTEPVEWSLYKYSIFDHRVPCSQPFQVGDRVKVVVEDPEFHGPYQRVDKEYMTKTYEVLAIHDLDVVEVHGFTFNSYCLEPSPIAPGEGWEIYVPNEGERYSDGTEFQFTEWGDEPWYGIIGIHHGLENGVHDDRAFRRPKKPAYVPPDGWRVKDSGFISAGDAFSHSDMGTPHDVPLRNSFVSNIIGMSVTSAIKNYMPNGGYILTPVTTPPADVSSELPPWFHEGASCPVDECNGRVVSVNKDGCRCHIAPPCSGCINSVLECSICGFTEEDAIDLEETPQQEVSKPLDIHLTYIESKVLAHPALRDWWFTRKMALAAEANEKIEEVMK